MSFNHFLTFAAAVATVAAQTTTAPATATSGSNTTGACPTPYLQCNVQCYPVTEYQCVNNALVYIGNGTEPSNSTLPTVGAEIVGNSTTTTGNTTVTTTIIPTTTPITRLATTAPATTSRPNTTSNETPIFNSSFTFTPTQSYAYNAAQQDTRISAMQPLYHPYSIPTSTRVQELVANLSLADRIGQLIEIDLNTYYYNSSDCVQGQPGVAATCEPTVSWVLNTTMLAADIQEYRIGSFLNSPSSGSSKQPTPAQWRQIINTTQQLLNESGVLPQLHGLDTVHGANYVYGAVLFPQSYTTAQSFNTSNAYVAGSVGAKDTRASGIPWIYSPILDIVSHQASSRTYETFGESPQLTAQMGTAYINGAQGDATAATLNNANNGKAAACAKHFLGYQAERNGQDHGPSVIGEQRLYNIYTPAFQAAISTGARSLMSMYQSIDQEVVGASSFYLGTLLRDTMQFEGMLVTDYNVVTDLYHLHHSASGYIESAYQGENHTSIDMFMLGTVNDYGAATNNTDIYHSLLNLVQHGYITEERINESVARILQLKEDLGLLDNSFVTYDENAVVGAVSEWQQALEAARESLVLLENNVVNISTTQQTQATTDTVNSLINGAVVNTTTTQPSLPLVFNATGIDTSNYTDFVQLSGTPVQRIAVVGPGGNSVSFATGGWSIHWQGAVDSEYSFVPEYYNQTITQALQSLSNNTVSVEYVQGVDVFGRNVNTTQALAAVQSADATVVVLAEHPYAEVNGLVNDTRFDWGQLDLVYQLRNVSNNLICVLYQGRLRNLDRIYLQRYGCDSLIQAGLPGPTGGLAVAETIYGLNNPSGRLSVTYTSGPSQNPLQVWEGKNEQFENVPLYPFGHGLSYANFTYNTSSGFDVTSFPFSHDVSVNVCNSGNRPGRDAVLLYTSQHTRPLTTPDTRILLNFTKVHLGVNQCTNVTFPVTSENLAQWNKQTYGWEVVRTGYDFWIGTNSIDYNYIDVYCSDMDTYYYNYEFNTGGCPKANTNFTQQPYFTVNVL